MNHLVPNGSMQGARRNATMGVIAREPNLIIARHSHGFDFRNDINGLRALAVLGVVIFHIDRRWAPGGYTGVDIFFVISGFLISRIILSECATGAFSLPGFYARRAKRILPALLVVVCFAAAWGWWWSDPAQYRQTGGDLLGNSYFTVNFWLLRQADGGYFAPDTASNSLMHLWSLSIEEQFYLIWPALMLVLIKLRKELVPAAILIIFSASLAYCLYITPRNPIEGFYLPWARAWELALGALLACREVFLLSVLPFPSRRVADIGAGIGMALMLGGFWLLKETQGFPGWRALIPTLGCALVIAHPGSVWGKLVLGNFVAAFFGLISYPLYLWHWPLLAFSRLRPGAIATPSVTVALAALAVALAAVTYRLVERPLDAPFRAHRYAVGLGLVAALLVTGLVGRQIYDGRGLPDRFPPLVARIFTYAKAGGPVGPLSQCFYDSAARRYSIEEERGRVERYFDQHQCTVIKDKSKPTIMVVGDSHAADLLTGVKEVFGGKTNIIALLATFCAPLIEKVDPRSGETATPRCQAISDYIFRQIRLVKPDVLLVGSYFSHYTNDQDWVYPNYLDAFVKNMRRLHQDGVHSIVVAGQVPTWAPWMPILVGNDILDSGSTPEFSNVGVRAESLATDKALSAKDWGEGVTYVSQAAKLCSAQGCRRLVGPTPPEDMLVADYGHYSVNGSIFAVKTILGPVIETELAKARASKASPLPQ